MMNKNEMGMKVIKKSFENMAVTPEPVSRSTDSNGLEVCSQNGRKSGNPVRYAVKAVAGVFIDCFTPPDDEHPSSLRKHGDFQHWKSSSGMFESFCHSFL